MRAEGRLTRERRVVEQMIRIYCRRKEGNESLCAACSELLAYAHARLEHCPYGVQKHTCRVCSTHCYRPVMREKIRRVMRFSGPRMLFYAPGALLRYLCPFFPI